MRFLLIVLLLLLTLPALAGEPAGVRLGNHDGYGRVVFDFPAPVGFTTERTGDVVVVRFTDAGEIPSAAGVARNVLGVAGGSSMATVTMAPGARLRAVRLGSRLVLDVLDAPAARPRAARPVPPPQVSPARQASAPAVVTTAEPPVAAVAAPPAAMMVTGPVVRPPSRRSAETTPRRCQSCSLRRASQSPVSRVS